MKKTPRLPVASVIAFDGVCLKLQKKSGGGWVCKPSPMRQQASPFPRHPKFTQKRR